MIKFADLQEKGAKKQAGSEKSAIQDLAQDESTRLDARHWYQCCCQFLEKGLEQVRSEEDLDLGEAKNLIEEIAQACLENNLPEELLIHALHGKEANSFLITNAVNVSVYAVILGTTFRLAREQLVELGLAALLHDIGKVRVSEKILYRKGSLTEKEMVLLRQYPYDSFKALEALGWEYHYLAECALQVNERLDGSGYPQGLQGDAINPYAQIIGLLDIYEAMTHDRPQRKKMTHFQAMTEIIKTQKQTFRPALLKALINTFAIFPLHSMVKLNSGAIGRVIETHEIQPLRPRIEIIVDAQKRRMQVPRNLDLRDQPVLYVVEAVADENLDL